MDETKLYSWFLGPKAENADLLERLVLEALRSTVMSPWLKLSRGGNPDYVDAFAAVLKQVIRSSTAVSG